MKKPLTPAQQKMRCGACGQIGHMRTNRECPVYMKTCGKSASRPPKERRAGGTSSGLNSTLDLHTSTSNDHLDDSGSHDGSKMFVSSTKPAAEPASMPTSLLESGPANGDSRPQIKMTIKRVDTSSAAGGAVAGSSSGALPGSAKKKVPSAGLKMAGFGGDGGGSGGEGGSRTKGGRLLSQASNSSVEKRDDYLQKPRQTSHRRRVDPLVALTSVLEVRRHLFSHVMVLPHCFQAARRCVLISKFLFLEFFL